MKGVRIIDLFDLSHTAAESYLSGFEYPWEALSGIGEMIKAMGKLLDDRVYRKEGEFVWIARDAYIAPTASISGPCIIGQGAEVRHCAFIRGNALVGNECVVGNSTELKNCILFDSVQVPHYNYVGDSILGYKAHMGAGAITSNVKSDKTEVVVKSGEGGARTGRKKVGAAVGDFAEIGCGSVLNPGAVIGRRATVYPLSSVRGIVPADSIYKSRGNISKRNF